MPATWGKVTAEEITVQTNGKLISGNQNTTFSGISTDSRNIRENELFWALVGDRFDGHDFTQKALEKNATGIVIQKNRMHKISRWNGAVVIAVDDSLRAFGDLAAWWRQNYDIRVAAITGSAGKTTTKEMAAAILGLGSHNLVTQGNFNNLIGLPKTLFRLESTHRSAILEMGMNRPGEIGRLTEIADPDVGVITNVGMAHIEGVGDIQGVANAKVELIEKMSHEGKLILNGDDALLLKTAAPFGKKALTFGLQDTNEIRATEITSVGREGVTFKLHYRGDSWPIKLNVPGIQNISNALAASAICLAFHETPEHIMKGLHGFSGVNKRFTLISLPGDITIVDDTYNANPSSLKAALDSIKTFVSENKRIIVGLGEMMELGDATISAHQQAGHLVGELGTRFFVAIGEHAGDMVKGAVDSGMNKRSVKTAGSHTEMIKLINEEMKEGDLVFLKGSNKINLSKVVEGLRTDNKG